jgi:cytochrome c556
MNRQRKSAQILLVGVFISALLLSLITGCSHQVGNKTLPQLEWTGKSALHKTRSAILREKMSSLRVLMFEYMYDELQFDMERARQAASIANIAKDMATTAMEVAIAQRELNLNADQVPVFQDYAQTLKNQALALEELARQEKSDAYPPMIRAIVETCNGCHEKFLDM